LGIRNLLRWDILGGGECGTVKFEKCDELLLGKAEIIKEGNDITVLAIGKMVSRTMEAVEELKNLYDGQQMTLKLNDVLDKDYQELSNEQLKENSSGIDVEVINVRFLMPLDKETILKSINKTKKVVIIEDNIVEGGLGTKVQELILEEKLNDIECLKIAYPVDFIKQGSVDEIEQKYGLDKKSIAKNLKMLYNNIEKFWEGMNF